MKRLLPCLLATFALLLLIKPVTAQIPFDAETYPFWAHEAVMDLQKAGIMIGYPDGGFWGQRAMTRDDFAIAMKRVLETSVAGNQNPNASNWTAAQVQVLLFSTLPETKEPVKANPSRTSLPRTEGNNNHPKTNSHKRKGHASKK